MPHNIRWHYREDSSDLSVINSTMINDEYGLHDLPPLSGWALDVGAHIGSVTVPLALDHPDLQVLAIEALSDNVKLLRENCEDNGIADRVTIIHAAISDLNGLTEVWSHYKKADGLTPEHLYNNRFIGNVIRSANHPEWEGYAETVEAVRLSTLLEDYGIGEVAFTKTDCEGGEWPLLADPAVRSLRYIVGEYHDRNEDALYEALHETHEVTTFPVGEGLGNFMAARRPHAAPHVDEDMMRATPGGTVDPEYVSEWVRGSNERLRAL